MEDNRFNLIELVKIWLRWKKHIFIVCSIAVIGSAIVSLIMPEYFKSTAIFYPYNPKLSDPRTLYVKDINYNIFGKSDDIDRIISIANSSLIHRDMIKEFDLINHYKIDTGKLAMTYALEEFRGNFDFVKNDEGALEITIYDIDQDLAAEMVKIMTGKINYINIETIKKNNEKLLGVYSQHTQSKLNEIKMLNDSLSYLRDKYKLYVPLSKVNLNSLNATTSKGVDEISTLEAQLTYLNEEYLAAKESYTQTKSTLENFKQSLFIVEEAVPAQKKSKPVRWLIVVSTLLIAFFLSSLYAVIIDFYRKDIEKLLHE